MKSNKNQKRKPDFNAQYVHKEHTNPARDMPSRANSSHRKMNLNNAHGPANPGSKSSYSRHHEILWSNISQHEAIGHQIALDRCDRAAYARIASRQEAHKRDHQQAGIEVSP